MKPLALKWRLTIPVALVMVAAMAVITGLAYDSFRDLVLKQTERSLLSAAEIIKTIMEDPSLAADRPAHIRKILGTLAIRAADKDRPEPMARVWLGANREPAIAIGPVAGCDALTERIGHITSPPAGQSVPFDVDTPQGGFRAVWLRAALTDGTACNIVVARSTAALYGELHELLWNLMLTTLGVIVAVSVISGVLIVLGLRPMHRTARRLAAITAGNIGQADWSARSLPVPVELEPFVDATAEMLHRLGEAMRQQKAFIADAAHELRTPIAVAKSTLQVALASERSSGEYRQALQEATNDLRRMERLVDDLLVLAQLDETQATVQTEELDLSQLLTDLAESYQNRIAKSGGSLVCHLSPARIRGNVLHVERLFSNLLDNALQHGPAGGEIRLELRKQESMFEILVQDQGGDVASEDLPRLFDRFYRADKSRSHSTGGIGLGLAIVKAIVSRHGGDIQIESTPGRGTRVRVRLPILRKVTARCTEQGG